MKIKRNKDGKPTGKTIRSYNYKNQDALGKKAIGSMIDCGAKGALKHNFHKKIGGEVHQPIFKRKNNFNFSHNELHTYEEERYLEEEDEREKHDKLMALPDK